MHFSYGQPGKPNKKAKLIGKNIWTVSLCRNALKLLKYALKYASNVLNDVILLSL